MSRRSFAVVFSLLGALLLLVAALSLRWRMAHDSAIMLYVAHLVDHFGRVPYREIFDINTPGVLFANLILGRLFGYGDLGFRVADLLALGVILVATWLCMKGLGRNVGIAAAILFGLAYLNGGAYLSLQREFLLLLPISLALAVAAAFPSLPAPTRAFIASFLFGIAATIKPHSALGYPVVLGFLLAAEPLPGGNGSRGRRRISLAAWSAAGFALPLIGAFLYLIARGALPAFVEIARDYWPFYPRLSGTHGTLEGFDRFLYLLVSFTRFGTLGLWLLPAGLGLSGSLFHSRLSRDQKRLPILLASLAAAYSFYPVLSAKFWPYHYLPLLYFLSLLAATSLVEGDPSIGKRQRALIIGALLLTVAAQGLPPREFFDQITTGRIEDPMMERADQIAGYLKANLKPGDKVQPLDWTGGSVQGMLMAGADLATSFYDDFHFYHHVSSPYIRSLRSRFISELDAAKPRFVIEVETDKPWVWGADTTREFPELRGRLLADYRPAFQGDGYIIHERR